MRKIEPTMTTRHDPGRPAGIATILKQADLTVPTKTAKMSKTAKQNVQVKMQRFRRLGRGYPIKTPVVPTEGMVPKNLLRVLNGALDGKIAWPLYVFGPAGVGKSYGVIWAINQIYESMYCLLEKLTDVVWDPEDYTWRQLRDSTLVAIDEIGMRNADRDYTALKKAADLREWKPTIYVSNLPPDDLCRVYDDRIYSRLCCGTICEVKGPDQRML